MNATLNQSLHTALANLELYVDVINTNAMTIKALIYTNWLTSMTYHLILINIQYLNDCHISYEL